MAVSLQVIYPIFDGTEFDYDYYLATHLPLVGEHLGQHVQNTLVTKGIAGGSDAPPRIYAIASIVFENHQAMEAAMQAAAPVLEDIPNFTNTQPEMMFGEVIG